MTWKDNLRVCLALGVPIGTVALAVPAMMAVTGGELPTVSQFAGFVGVMVAVLIATGTVIPLIGGDEV